MQHSIEFLPNGTKVWINNTHRFGTDALLLANFCEIHPNWSACDFGSGCGILSLALKDRGIIGAVTGIDIQPEATALLQGATEENNFQNLSALTMDIQNYKPTHKVDLLISNPPYFTGGAVSPNPARALARHQNSLSLSQVCTAVPRVLKEKGRFRLCFPAKELAILFSTLQRNRIEPKRLQLVRKNKDVSPWLALVEARLGGGVGLTILPDCLLPAAKPVQY